MQDEIGVAPSVTDLPSVSADSPSLEEGWALKKAKRRSLPDFLYVFGLFLQDTSFEGEETGVPILHLK